MQEHSTSVRVAGGEARLLYLDPRHLDIDEQNVRREAGDLEGLAASLRRYGVLQPLGVAPVAPSGRDGQGPASGTSGRYRVVYGNRRREAAILAGLATVPCLPVALHEASDHLVTQLLENMQRRDLNDMEKAEGLGRLRRQVAAEMGSAARAEAVDARVAELVGLAPRTVRRYLALRELPPAVRDLLAEERLSVTQAQHLSQLGSAQRQAEVAARAAEEDWTAAQVSTVCAALVRSPGLSVEEAVRAAAGGWQQVEELGPRPAGAAEAAGPAAAPPARPPRRPAASAEEDDAELWQEDATGAPTPEATGEADVFAERTPSGRPLGAEGAPGTADGQRVFRIRTLAAFCDEVDRLARCIQDGDLARSAAGDPSSATRLRLAAKQLAFTLSAVEALAGA